MTYVSLYGYPEDFRKSVIIRLKSYFHLVRLRVPFIVTNLVGSGAALNYSRSFELHRILSHRAASLWWQDQHSPSLRHSCRVIPASYSSLSNYRFDVRSTTQSGTSVDMLKGRHSWRTEGTHELS